MFELGRTTAGGWPAVRPAEYLAPFLEAVRSVETSAPITAAALAAVHRILRLRGALGASTPHAQEAVHAVIDAVTGCRFEVTDPASEEVVLMKILQVLLACLQCEAGALLTDRDVCNVVNTCFRVVHQAAAKGELLQQMACHTMQEMVRTLFARLPDLSPSALEDDNEAAAAAFATEGTLSVPEVDSEMRQSSPVSAQVGDNEGGLRPNGPAMPSVNGQLEEDSTLPSSSSLEEASQAEVTGATDTAGGSDPAVSTATDASSAEGRLPGSLDLVSDAEGSSPGSRGRPPLPPGSRPVWPAPLDVGASPSEVAAASSPRRLAGSPSSRRSNEAALGQDAGPAGSTVVGRPHGVPCMVEIFHFLCSLLSLDDVAAGLGPGRPGGGGGEEDMPLFALGLITTALELCGPAVADHPKLLALVQDELFRSLMQLGLSTSPPLLSLVCSAVLSLYQFLRRHLKLQLEAFFVVNIVRLAQGKYGASYQQQEVAMEALVDFVRQPPFMAEMFANLDCDITCSNAFEDLTSLLSKSAFPVNSPLTTMHVLALDGLLALVHAIGGRVDALAITPMPSAALAGAGDNGEQTAHLPFWTARCDYGDPARWVGFVRTRKHVKRRLAIGADHFNRDPKKGLEFLQGAALLPTPADASSVACFFRYTPGLSKSLLGEYFGDPEPFHIAVLRAFTALFDFTGMLLDAALRTYLESFRLPGEAQKIERVLEAFAAHYYDQCPELLPSENVAHILSYSIIMLNTDLHNLQVKRKMTEEQFIHNNREIDAGKNLPRETLAELYKSIARNEIRISSDGNAMHGAPEMTYSRWIDLIRRSQTAAPYTLAGSAAALLDHDMFAIIAGPTIAAISVVFDHTEDEEVLQECMEGFLEVAKICARHRLEGVLDDLVVSLCKFTTLLNPSSAAFDDPVLVFGEDLKARMAAMTAFTVANRYGDHIGPGWRNILDCILRLHKLGLLPSKVAAMTEAGDEASDGTDSGAVPQPVAVASLQPMGARKRSTGLMSRFSQLLLLDGDDARAQPTEQQLAAHQRSLRAVEVCHIDQLFTDSRFLQADSLQQLAKALVWEAGRPQQLTQKSGGGGAGGAAEDEDTAIFCLELLILVALTNRDRIALLWPLVYEYMSSIVASATAPGPLVEKAVFGLLHICQRLLPYKEELADELLRSLQLILKLDARVADAFCERITLEVSQLVRTSAGYVRSAMGWRTVCSLLAITARHPEASEPGFSALEFLMADGAHVTPTNYVPCLDAARQFADARIGGVERSLKALDLLVDLTNSLQRWSMTVEKDAMASSPAKAAAAEVAEAEQGLPEADEGTSQGALELAELWQRLAHGLRRVSRDHREEVRNHAILSLQRCLLAAEHIYVPLSAWGPCFDQVIFVMLDDLLECGVREKPKDFRGMENTLYHAMKLLSRILLQFLEKLSTLSTFRGLWLAALTRMEMYMKAKVRGGSEELRENIPELLKNLLLVMHARGVLVPAATPSSDSLWELTCHHVEGISASLIAELFPPPPPAPHAPEGESTQPLRAEEDQSLAVNGAGLLASAVVAKSGHDSSNETNGENGQLVREREGLPTRL
eukprot:SM000017S02750  [mRNA]  locus=s17:5236:10862:- [translate_table: standard]